MKLFDQVTEKAVVWVKDMMAELGTDDPRKAHHALRAGLHALRDRLSVNEAAHLSAQLPLLIRGLFFENWVPGQTPLRVRHKADFRALIREKYAPRSDASPDEIMTAVVRVLGKHITQGEVTDVIMSLPGDLLEVTGTRSASV